MTAATKTARRKKASGTSVAASERPATRRRATGTSKTQQARAKEEARELKDALAKASGGRAARAAGRPPARKLSSKERQSLKGVVIYLDEEARKQLARLAIDQGRTTQDLGVEAVNLLFQLYGVGTIA
jgi:hypothetical protein